MIFYGLNFNFFIPLLYLYYNRGVLIEIKWLITKSDIKRVVGNAKFKKWTLMEEYFDKYFGTFFLKEKRKLPDIPLELSGKTSFTLNVLEIIKTIPCSKTLTYGDISNILNKKSASQAVGQVCKNNPFPIVIPCHRVISKNGVGGYTGQNKTDSIEVYLKRKLLKMERINIK